MDISLSDAHNAYNPLKNNLGAPFNTIYVVSSYRSSLYGQQNHLFRQFMFLILFLFLSFPYNPFILINMWLWWNFHHLMLYNFLFFRLILLHTKLEYFLYWVFLLFGIWCTILGSYYFVCCFIVYFLCKTWNIAYAKMGALEQGMDIHQN